MNQDEVSGRRSIIKHSRHYVSSSLIGQGIGNIIASLNANGKIKIYNEVPRSLKQSIAIEKLKKFS